MSTRIGEISWFFLNVRTLFWGLQVDRGSASRRPLSWIKSAGNYRNDGRYRSSRRYVLTALSIEGWDDIDWVSRDINPLKFHDESTEENKVHGPIKMSLASSIDLNGLSFYVSRVWSTWTQQVYELNQLPGLNWSLFHQNIFFNPWYMQACAIRLAEKNN